MRRGKSISFFGIWRKKEKYGREKKKRGDTESSRIKRKNSDEFIITAFLGMGESGFEPLKAVPADLQSVPFGHSGTPPGAGDRSRTNNLLITNQLLCH